MEKLRFFRRVGARKVFFFSVRFRGCLSVDRRTLENQRYLGLHRPQSTKLVGYLNLEYEQILKTKHTSGEFELPKKPICRLDQIP